MIFLGNKSKPASVCLYTSNLGPGGAERQVAILAKALAARGVNVHVVCNNLEGENAHHLYLLKEGGVNVDSLNKNDFIAGVKFIKSNQHLLDGLRKFSLPNISLLHLIGRLSVLSPDILHCYLDVPNCVGGCAGLLASIPGILLSFRTSDPSSRLRNGTTWALSVYKFLYTHSNVYMEANSAQGARDYASWLNISDSEISISYNGIYHDLYKRRNEETYYKARDMLDIPRDVPVVLYMARFVEEKRPIDMLLVVEQLHRQIPNICFLVAGDGMGECENLSTPVRELGISDNVRLLGIRKDIPNLLAASDVLLLTSQIEGLPNVIMEAMCTGLPVVATNVGGVPELVCNGVDGFLHHVGDIQGMSASLACILNDRDLRYSMGNNARERIINNFTIDKLLNTTLAKYTELLKINSGSTLCSSQ